MTINNLPQNLVPNAADLLVIWSAANADNRTLALSDVAKHVVGTIVAPYADFATRAAFITWALGVTPAVGTVINAAGYAYRFIGTGTAIAGLAGWVPQGDATPFHWGATGDGVVDDLAAFTAAKTYGLPLYIPKPPVSYKFSATLNLGPLSVSADPAGQVSSCRRSVTHEDTTGGAPY